MTEKEWLNLFGPWREMKNVDHSNLLRVDRARRYALFLKDSGIMGYEPILEESKAILIDYFENEMEKLYNGAKKTESVDRMQLLTLKGNISHDIVCDIKNDNPGGIEELKKIHKESWYEKWEWF